MTRMLVFALAVRLLLELILLAVFALWGFHAASALPLRLLAGLGAPAAAALAWGLFVSPSRRVELGRIPRLVLELALFALAAGALWQRGHAITGLLLFILAAADRFFLIWLRRRELARHNARYRSYS
jgi:hypothetical protein